MTKGDCTLTNPPYFGNIKTIFPDPSPNSLNTDCKRSATFVNKLVSPDVFFVFILFVISNICSYCAFLHYSICELHYPGNTQHYTLASNTITHLVAVILFSSGNMMPSYIALCIHMVHFKARQQLMASAKKKKFVEVTVKSIYPRYSHRKAENIIRLATIRVHNKQAQNLCGGCVSYKNTSSAPILHLFLLFLHQIKLILLPSSVPTPAQLD